MKKAAIVGSDDGFCYEVVSGSFSSGTLYSSAWTLTKLNRPSNIGYGPKPEP